MNTFISIQESAEKSSHESAIIEQMGATIVRVKMMRERVNSKELIAIKHNDVMKSELESVRHATMHGACDTHEVAVSFFCSISPLSVVATSRRRSRLSSKRQGRPL